MSTGRLELKIHELSDIANDTQEQALALEKLVADLTERVRELEKQCSQSK